MAKQKSWLDEIFEPPKPKPKGAFTVNEICKKTGIQKRTLVWRLNEQVRLGTLIKGKCVEDSKVCNYFLPTKKKNK